MDRSTIEQVVLEQIYKLAGINPPAASEDSRVSGLSTRGAPSAWRCPGFLRCLAIDDDSDVVANSQKKETEVMKFSYSHY